MTLKNVQNNIKIFHGYDHCFRNYFMTDLIFDINKDRRKYVLLTRIQNIFFRNNKNNKNC